MSVEIGWPQRPRPEWPATLAVEKLLAAGWQPRPFRQFILKVHSRCNLSCDYCYVYAHADQGWRTRPRVMPDDVLDTTLRRIAEHARTHDVAKVRVILHGGEPLLTGRSWLAALIGKTRNTLDVDVEFVLQTNGVLLEEGILGDLVESGVRIGVSLDGGEQDNDRHRRTVAGTGSYAAVARALALLNRPEFRASYAGILCTVDVTNDPVATYDALAAFDPPMIDLLLPHATWAAPPPPHAADWLIAVYDHWRAQPRGAPRIRLFEEIVYLLMGGTSGMEAVGITPTTSVVVETDGTIEQSDFLKVVGTTTATGKNVTDHTFDEVLFQPDVAVRQMGMDGLADKCRSCRYGRVCGGGHYAHRYREGSGFLNPSVHCADLYRLINHIHVLIQSDLGGRDIESPAHRSR